MHFGTKSYLKSNHYHTAKHSLKYVADKNQELAIDIVKYK
jgi:hypothetical protein